jgi:hypothetical protein
LNHAHQLLGTAVPQHVLCRAFGVALVLLLCISMSARGDVVIETVFVGNVGNAPDDTGYGFVGVVYRMGKYEVTTAQYGPEQSFGEDEQNVARRQRVQQVCTQPLHGTTPE